MEDPPPSDNVWVGDLPPDLDKDGLLGVFAAYGSVVDCRVMPPKQPGQNACAMVRFASLDEATWVVQNLNGNIPTGLKDPIACRYANNPGGGGGGGKGWAAASTPVAATKGGLRPSPYSGGAGGGGGGGWGAAGGKATGDPPPSDNIWVGDLPPELDKQLLHRIFENYGHVVDCRVMPPKLPGQKACAMVRFASLDEATVVVQNLNGQVPDGLSEPIVCRYANSPGGGGGGGKGWAAASTPVAAGKGGPRPSPYGGGSAGGGQVVLPPAYAPAGAAWGKGGKQGPPGSAEGLLRDIRHAGVTGGGKVPVENQVYVKNLPPDMTDLDLFKLFSPFGAIATWTSGVKVMINEDGSCKGFGFVDYVDQASVELAVASLNGFTCSDGGIINVSSKLKKQAAPVAVSGRGHFPAGTGAAEGGL